MKTSIGFKLVFIIFACTFWIIFIPGFVAYKHNVFYGSMFKDRIPESVIVSRINSEDITKIYKDKRLVEDTITINKTVTFAGFAENGLNFVWLESYIILCVYAFLVYYRFSKIILNRSIFFLTLLTIILFHSSTWIRNSGEFGKYGRTIYTYVNYDIDQASFWLQELRGYIFAFLLSIFWYQFELRKREASKMVFRFARRLNPNTFIELTRFTKVYFNNWQRDIIISILLFLP